MKIYCEKCFYDKDETKLHLHHIIPKIIGGTDKDGRIYLCGKCHNIITYAIIIKVLWRHIKDKEEAKKELKEETLNWLEEKEEDILEEDDPDTITKG